MKKSVKLLALCMALVMLCLAMVSCGNKPSGTYEASLAAWDVELTFKGNDVTAKITGKLSGNTTEAAATYTIEDDKITFTSEDEMFNRVFGSQSMSYEKTDDGIKLGILGEFKKK